MNSSETENNLQEQNYFICELKGFDNLVLKNNDKYIVNNELIKFISISDDVKSMFVALKNNITFSEYEDEINEFLYHICFNLIIKTDISYHTPVYRISVIHENGKPLECREYLRFKEVLKISYSVEAKDIYNQIVNSPTDIEDNFVKYERIFKTLHNPNSIVQFMSLYQYLMELLQGTRSHVSQKSVIDYLEANKEKYPFLYFKQTRRNDASYDEDCFTYMRNEIGHSEETNDLSMYQQLGSQITQGVIKNLVTVINDVILE